MTYAGNNNSDPGVSNATAGAVPTAASTSAEVDAGGENSSGEASNMEQCYYAQSRHQHTRSSRS